MENWSKKLFNINNIVTNNNINESEKFYNKLDNNLNNIEKFNKDGFLLIPSVLDENKCNELRNIIDKLDEEELKKMDNRHNKQYFKENKHIVHKTVFEKYPTECLDIFKNDTILPIVKELLGMAKSSRENDRSLIAHVIHNNAFKIQPGGRGQAPTWHTDDAPLFSGELPEYINVAPMVLTCMYYLNDVYGSDDGMTHIIPGSHRLGRPCTNEEVMSSMQEKIYCPEFIPKGSVLIISSSIWHKGNAVSKTGNSRYLFQVSYGRRLIGHKHKSIMNYMLPQNVIKKLQTSEDKELMGYLQGGAYS
jgi:ectoine hydroxylase-related dioxygenase (phytanoyl-CoA dioxygenase family)